MSTSSPEGIQNGSVASATSMALPPWQPPVGYPPPMEWQYPPEMYGGYSYPPTSETHPYMMMPVTSAGFMMPRPPQTAPPRKSLMPPPPAVISHSFDHDDAPSPDEENKNGSEEKKNHVNGSSKESSSNGASSSKTTTSTTDPPTTSTTTTTTTTTRNGTGPTSSDEIRRERNREYARQSRERKRREFEALQEYDQSLRDALGNAERQIATLQDSLTKSQEELEGTRQGYFYAQQEQAKLRTSLPPIFFLFVTFIFR